MHRMLLLFIGIHLSIVCLDIGMVLQEPYKGAFLSISAVQISSFFSVACLLIYTIGAFFFVFVKKNEHCNCNSLFEGSFVVARKCEFPWYCLALMRFNSQRVSLSLTSSSWLAKCSSCV